MNKAVRNTLLVLAPVALIAGVWWTFYRSDDPIPNQSQFVDITTGQLFTLDPRKLLLIPAQNADGRFVLYPVERGEDGSLAVPGRYLSTVELQLQNKELKEDELKIDRQSGRLNAGS